jgi:hypothetical protein
MPIGHSAIPTVKSMRSSNRRLTVFWTLALVTFVLWLLRGVGLLTIVPGFVLLSLMVITWVMALVNGFLETR